MIDGPGTPHVPFFERVWDMVRLIPLGKVATYRQVAILVEHPHGARTVGWALQGLRGKNDVPWQRVINSRGGISTTWLTNPPGLQRTLLEQEGVEFDEHGRVDFQRFGWEEWDPQAIRQRPAQAHMGG